MFGLASVLLAAGVRALPEDGPWHRMLGAVLRSRTLLAVLTAYLLGWGFHLISIALLPLFLAQAGVAASLVLSAVGAAWWLGERLTRRQWLSIFVTALGLGLLIVAAGDTGTNDFDRLAAGLVLAGTVLIGSLGWWAVRTGRHGMAVGLLAGLAYAGSPLATRALSNPQPDLSTLLVAGTIPVYGLIGFWLYSVAMRRTTVALATTPLVIAETVLPAVCGMIWLGDQVRPGLAWLVLVGLVLSMAGAVAVERPVAPPERVSP